MRESMKFVFDEREQFIESSLVALTPVNEEACDVGGAAAGHESSGVGSVILKACSNCEGKPKDSYRPGDSFSYDLVRTSVGSKTTVGGNWS